MRNMLPRRLLAALMVGLIALLSACGSSPMVPPPPVTPPAGTHELTKADLDAWLDGKLPDVLTKGKASGAVVAVVKDGKVLTSRGYGHVTRGENGQPATPVDPETTLFRWGSISKVPTSIAAMQLVGQGKLDLDADITTYADVPLRKHHDQPITLRHLLTHTAGFEETMTMANPGLRDMALADYVRHNPPVSLFRPGTTPAYSNYGMTLVGYLVEQASGQPFHDYVKEHVLKPAGMATASYDQPLPADRLAISYDSDGQPAPFQVIPDVPAGTLAGSGADAAAFMLAQLGRSPQILSAQSWEQMWTPALGVDALGNLANSPRMGLGYFTGVRNGHRIVEHGGDLEHYHSKFEIYPDDQMGVFISFTGEINPQSRSLRSELLDGFADRYLPTTTVETPHLEGSAERANQVAGSYFDSRSMMTTWPSAWNGLFTESIQVLPNGNLLYQDREFVEVAPWVWKNPNTGGSGSILTARVVDGKVEALGVGPAYTLLPITFTQQAFLPVFIASLAVFVLTLFSWTVGAIKRRIRTRGGHPSTGLPWLARITRLGALAAATALVGWMGVGLIIAGSNYDLLGNTAVFRTIQALQWAGIAAIIPATLDVITVVKTRAGWKRATMAVLLLLALLATAWWAWAGNALNPNLSV